MKSDIPLGGKAIPETSGIISFLASPECGWINRQVIKANVGRH